MEKVYINSISYYLPDQILDNTQLSNDFPEWSVDKIAQKTGIKQRHIASNDEYSSDMGYKVIEKFFAENKIEREDIDFLLFCTQTPDYLLPTTACILQYKCRLSKSVGALDFNLGCSGYIYGLGLSKGLILSGQAKNILLVTSETYSKLMHPKDKSNRTIFGDGATATLISDSRRTHTALSIDNFTYGTDGSGSDKLIVRNSGIKHNCYPSSDILDEEGNFQSNDDFLYMDGKAIFNFTAFEVPPLIKQVLHKNSVKLDDINVYIFHQANQYMLDFVRKRCEIPKERFYITINDVGNTVSNTIPIALKRYTEENELVKGHKILLAGFGVGLSLGGVVLTVD